MSKNIKELLIDLKICCADCIEIFHKGVRDNPAINVMKCNKTGLLFLSTKNDNNNEYYENKKNFSYWSSSDQRTAKLTTYEDDSRRAEQFKSLIINKKWLDFGTGNGGILDLLNKYSKTTYAIEIQKETRESLLKQGYKVYESLNEIKNNSLDIITMFHVLEHLTNPIEILSSLKNKLSKTGKIIIEVPHANDFLISTLNHDKFKDFTFWSEHLILHTRESLKIFLEVAGFKNINIIGFQRYPLSNHLYWLTNNLPNGHNQWSFLNSKELATAYENILIKNDKTDTLIAFAEK